MNDLEPADTDHQDADPLGQRMLWLSLARTVMAAVRTLAALAVAVFVLL